MILQELSLRKVAILTAAVTLLVAAVFLCWYLEGHNLSILIPAIGILLGFAGTVLFAMVPDVARMFPAWLLKLLPGFVSWSERQEELKTSHRLVRDMEAGLAFYNVSGVPLGQPLRDEIVRDLQAAWLSDASGRLHHCSRLLSPIVNLQPAVLTLLYRERQNLQPQPLWPRHPEREEWLADLAGVLAKSEIIDRHHGAEIQLDRREIQELLEPLRTFHLEDFLIELREVRDLYQVAESYWEFFAGNFRVVDEVLEVRDLIAGIEWTRSEEYLTSAQACREIARSLVTLLLRQGFEALRADDRLHDDVDREAMASLALLLFFTRTGTELDTERYKALCRHLAKIPQDATPPWTGRGVRLAWLYLVAKQEFRSGLWGESERYLRLDLFLDRRDDVLTRRHEEVDELRSLYYELCRGRWVIRRDELIARVFIDSEDPDNSEDSDERPPPKTTDPGTDQTPARRLVDVIRSIPHSEIPLKTLFRRLHLPTLEHFAETKRLRPYLITLGRSKGPIPALLDCLASERKIEVLAEAGIDVSISDGVRKYNFEHYTPFARIGVVPPGLAFIDFCQDLERDLRKALRRQDVLLPPSERVLDSSTWSYEVLVHTFRPAIGNPYEFGQPAGERPAMQRVKDILAAHVDEDDLAQLGSHLHAFQTGTRTSLVAALMQNPIGELSGLEKELSPEARRALDRADSWIKHELLSALDIGPYDDQALNRALQPDAPQRDRARKILERALEEKLPDPEHDLAPKVATGYLEQLAATSNTLHSLESLLGRGWLVSSGGP